MNDAELALGVPFALGLVFVGATFFVPAMQLARRWIPEREAAAARWDLREILGVVLLTLVAMFVLAGVLGDGWPLAPLVVVELAQGIAALWVVQRARGRAGGLASLGLGTYAGGRAFLAGALAFLPLYLFQSGVAVLWAFLMQLLGRSSEQEVVVLLRGLSGADRIAGAVLAVLVAPFLEELLFRGLLLGALSARYGARAGLLVTSFLFALMHGRDGLIVLLALSLFLGWLQQRSRCLWLPWSVHALNNGVALALAFSVPSG